MVRLPARAELRYPDRAKTSRAVRPAALTIGSALSVECAAAPWTSIPSGVVGGGRRLRRVAALRVRRCTKTWLTMVAAILASCRDTFERVMQMPEA